MFNDLSRVKDDLLKTPNINAEQKSSYGYGESEYNYSVAPLQSAEEVASIRDAITHAKDVYNKSYDSYMKEYNRKQQEIEDTYQEGQSGKMETEMLDIMGHKNDFDRDVAKIERSLKYRESKLKNGSQAKPRRTIPKMYRNFGQDNSSGSENTRRRR